MDFKIKLPVCAAVRDRNELEYISALGQIGKVVRSNGTIMSKYYLKLYLYYNHLHRVFIPCNKIGLTTVLMNECFFHLF